MGVLSVYKMELYKAFKRKNTWMLIIPGVLAVLVALGVGSGVLELSADGQGVSAISCMDFVQLTWGLLTGLGIWGILMILLAAFQFSGEISDGQIKMALLRTGKRRDVVIGKYLAVLTVILVFLAVFFLVCIAGYYVFVANAAVGSGVFAPSGGVSIGNMSLSLGCDLLNYAILIALTFLIGIYAGPFITFIVVLVVMFAANYMAGLESLKFMQYTPIYVSGQLLTGGGLTEGHVIAFLACTILTIGVIMGLTLRLFRKTDVK